MSDNVRLREIAGSAEARVQLIEKLQIQINFMISRAVKRPHGGLGKAAGGIHRAGK